VFPITSSESEKLAKGGLYGP